MGINAENPYTRLANEIILQAVKDYREANVKLSHGRANHMAQKDKNDCLRFFRSDWFAQLTDIDPEMLIGRLDKEVMS